MKEACNCGRTGEVEDPETVLGTDSTRSGAPTAATWRTCTASPATPERPYSKSLHAGGIGRTPAATRSGQCRPHGLRSSRQMAGKTFTG